MANDHDELNSLLDDTRAFLRQQRELYGDTLSFDASESVSSTPVIAHSEMKSPKSTILPKSEVDLFGNSEAPLKTLQVTVPRGAYPNEPWVSATTLDGLNGMICTCTKCPLGHTRKNFVFGVGNPQAEVVVIGEAPGADEDEQGEPFVGRAGQLLNKILDAVQFKREEVYICNILKCRPPENRRPTPEEIELCEPHLWKQLEIIKPKMILALGLTAAQALLKTNSSLGQLRGKFLDYRGITLMVTYHPAALLRNPNWKRPTWEDVQLFRKEYDKLKSGQ